MADHRIEVEHIAGGINSFGRARMRRAVGPEEFSLSSLPIKGLLRQARLGRRRVVYGT
jgi:hypothetical protein